MRVRCVAEQPTPEQARTLGLLYQGGKQTFGVTVGAEYMVFGLSVVAGVTLVQIAQEFEQLVPVPLFLFEITDPRVPSLWQIRQDDDGAVLLWPQSFFSRPSYHTELLDKVPSVVEDFRRVRRRLELEEELASQ